MVSTATVVILFLCALFLAATCSCEWLEYNEYVKNAVKEIVATRMEVEIKENLGARGSAVAFRAIDGDTGTAFELKLFRVEDSLKCKHEFDVYFALNAHVPMSSPVNNGDAWKAGIPGAFGHGFVNYEGVNWPFIALELLHSPLMFYCCAGDAADLKIIIDFQQWVDIGAEMVKSIEYIHSKNVVHGDVKPVNFMVGEYKSGGNDSTIVAKVFLTNFSGSYIGSVQRTSKDLCGNFKFMSIREHNIISDLSAPNYPSFSPKSDIESCMYSFLYLDASLNFEWVGWCPGLAELYRDKARSTQSDGMTWSESVKDKIRLITGAKTSFLESLQNNLEKVTDVTGFVVIVRDLLAFGMGRPLKTNNSCLKEFTAAWQQYSKKPLPILDDKQTSNSKGNSGKGDGLLRKVWDKMAFSKRPEYTKLKPIDVQ